MEKEKYSELQTHTSSYPKGTQREIIDNSKQKAFDYMKDKSAGGLDYTAMSYYGSRISYSYMLEQIELYAKALKNYGIGHGDFVTLVLPNIPEMVYIKYADNGDILEQGKVECPIEDINKAINFMGSINYKHLFKIYDKCIVYANAETELVVH